MSQAVKQVSQTYLEEKMQIVKLLLKLSLANSRQLYTVFLCKEGSCLDNLAELLTVLIKL